MQANNNSTSAIICSDPSGFGRECERKVIDEITNCMFCRKHPGGCASQRNVFIEATITSTAHVEQQTGVTVQVDVLGLIVYFDFIESTFVHECNPDCYITREIAERTARKIARKSTFKVEIVEGDLRDLVT